MSRFFSLLPLVAVMCALIGCRTCRIATNSDVYRVLDYGAKADGKTDATAAFQKAMDTAAEAGGGIVYAPRGNYFFLGHLDLPRSVTLKGVWESVPAHNGIRDQGGVGPMDGGTTFLVMEGAGKEDGAPFITMHDDSTLKGVVLYYPNQTPDGEPTPYPWAIAMRGKNPAVLGVELLNPYNGIDASDNERHLIRDVQGQPLRRGIFVDEIYDIGRIEDVHFNPWWSVHRRLLRWQEEHGEAFIFARSDWQYVFNTFCFGYNIGYKFVKSEAGVCNGNFLGIGADDCFASVEVDASAEYGLLISNGEFTSFHGPDPTMVRVGTNNAGSVRFENCAFWGPCNQIAEIAGNGTVGFGDCTFCQWDRNDESRAAIQAESGTVLVRGCEFQEDKPQVDLEKAVRRAVITGNVFTGKARISNRSSHAVINDNAGE